MSSRERKIVPLAYACFRRSSLPGVGFQRLQSVGDDMAGAGKLSVGAVQGNVDIDMKWNPVLARKNPCAPPSAHGSV
jgi:hypothetical protein